MAPAKVHIEDPCPFGKIDRSSHVTEDPKHARPLFNR